MTHASLWWTKIGQWQAFMVLATLAIFSITLRITGDNIIALFLATIVTWIISIIACFVALANKTSYTLMIVSYVAVSAVVASIIPTVLIIAPTTANDIVVVAAVLIVLIVAEAATVVVLFARGSENQQINEDSTFLEELQASLAKRIPQFNKKVIILSYSAEFILIFVSLLIIRH